MQVTSAATTATANTSAGSAANTGAASASAKNASSAANMGYNNFLQLLMAQVKNQDPTKPMDSTQWVSQLATFSGVEQAVQTNKLLGTMINNSNLTNAESYIGRTITSSDGSISGIVKSVTVSSSGSLANFTDGKSLLLSNNVTVS